MTLAERDYGVGLLIRCLLKVDVTPPVKRSDIVAWDATLAIRTQIRTVNPWLELRTDED